MGSCSSNNIKVAAEFLKDITDLNPNDKVQLFNFLNKYYDLYDRLGKNEKNKFDDLFKISTLRLGVSPVDSPKNTSAV
jgi:hypothetical protein